MNLMMIAEPKSQVRLAGGMVSPVVPLDGIDWERELAVVVDMGEQRTGGFGLSIRQVRVVAPDRVELELDVRRPGPGSFVTQAFTRPHAVARVPRAGLSAGPVTLVAMDQSRAEVARRVVAL